MLYIFDYNGEENGKEKVGDQNLNKTQLKNRRNLYLQLFPFFKSKTICLFVFVFFYIEYLLKLLFLNM